MVECQTLGLAKSIGVSNFNIRQIQTLLDYGSVKPASNQVTLLQVADVPQTLVV